MPPSVFLVRYSEIALKGGNRPWFEDALARHIRGFLKAKGAGTLRRIRGRFIIDANSEAADAVAAALGRIPGVQNFSAGERCVPELQALRELCLRKLAGCRPDDRPVSFRITATRSDKSFPLKSGELNADVGAYLLGHAAPGLKVNLDDPDIEVQIEVHPKEAFVFVGKTPGPGGLPVGTAGEVLCLVSGGIDSPVAAWQMIRRGCRAHAVYFENRPFLGRAAYHKVRKLLAVLGRFQGAARLFVAPFAEIQEAIRDHCHEAFRVVLYRRFMMRIASALARREGCLGLVTGENLGQVASQTLENMHAVNSVADLCVYRPLIGLDKLDIIAQAEALGTYGISIEEAPDCCAVFLPSHPVTRSRVSDLEHNESKLDVAGLVERCLAGIEAEVVEAAE